MTVLLSKIIEIAILVLSLAFGFLAYYFFSDAAKSVKKKQLEELVSQFVNLVIFIWLGKIIFKFTVFITDPLAVLAQPSDSKSFYLAIILVVFVILRQSKMKKLNGLQFLEAVTYTFLIGSFFYEFFLYMVNDQRYALGYIILLTILIVILLFLPKYFPMEKLFIIILTAWCIGIVILSVVQPYVTVFGYIMKLWFIVIIYVSSIGILFYRARKVI